MGSVYKLMLRSTRDFGCGVEWLRYYSVLAHQKFDLFRHLGNTTEIENVIKQLTVHVKLLEQQNLQVGSRAHWLARFPTRVSVSVGPAP